MQHPLSLVVETTVIVLHLLSFPNAVESSRLIVNWHCDFLKPVNSCQSWLQLEPPPQRLTRMNSCTAPSSKPWWGELQWLSPILVGRSPGGERWTDWQQIQGLYSMCNVLSVTYGAPEVILQPRQRYQRTGGGEKGVLHAEEYSPPPHTHTGCFFHHASSPHCGCLLLHRLPWGPPPWCPL